MFNQPRPQVQTITAQEVYQRLTGDDEAQQPAVIDVREAEEWAEGHIAGAQHIPLGQLGARTAEVPKDRDVVLVCHLGGRSEMATVLLNRAGFTRAVNMVGGMDAWEGQHLPVER
jgi:rhodanese-related sulfurtransferase